MYWIIVDDMPKRGVATLIKSVSGMLYNQEDFDQRGKDVHRGFAPVDPYMQIFSLTSNLCVFFEKEDAIFR